MALKIIFCRAYYKLGDLGGCHTLLTRMEDVCSVDWAWRQHLLIHQDLSEALTVWLLSLNKL